MYCTKLSRMEEICFLQIVVGIRSTLIIGTFSTYHNVYAFFNCRIFVVVTLAFTPQLKF